MSKLSTEARFKLERLARKKDVRLQGRSYTGFLSKISSKELTNGEKKTIREALEELGMNPGLFLGDEGG